MKTLKQFLGESVDRNVDMILDQKFRMVRNRIPQQVRTALNQAVKANVLGYVKKDGMRPEMYFNPKYKDLAMKTREDEHRRGLDILSKVMG
jgi:hypothetical protein